MKTRNGPETRAAILAAIRRSVRERNMPPTRQELADTVGLASTSSVDHHIRALVALGAIRCLPGKARGVVLADIYPDTNEAVSAPPETAPDPTNGATEK